MSGQLLTKHSLALKKNCQRTIVAKLEEEIKLSSAGKRLIKFNCARVLQVLQNAFFDENFFHPSFRFEFLRKHLFESEKLMWLRSRHRLLLEFLVSELHSKDCPICALSKNWTHSEIRERQLCCPLAPKLYLNFGLVLNKQNCFLSNIGTLNFGLFLLYALFTCSLVCNG